MAARSEFLMFGRRIHYALRHAIEDGDGRTDDEWLKVERPLFEHGMCSMYLLACLAYLEGKYQKAGSKEKPWSTPGIKEVDFDKFFGKHKAYPKFRIDKKKLDALVCIRNAITHNNCDLARNTDKQSLSKVIAASINGVTINGSNVILTSTNWETDFLEFVRHCYLSVSEYYGDI